MVTTTWAAADPEPVVASPPTSKPGSRTRPLRTHTAVRASGSTRAAASMAVRSRCTLSAVPAPEAATRPV